MSLSPAAIQALEAGRIIDAIKLVRQETAWALKMLKIWWMLTWRPTLI